MNTPIRVGFFVALVSASAVPALAQSSTQAKPKPEAPPAKDAAAASISPELIAQGDKVYHGAGNCYACHGNNAEGLVGPSLTDAEWIHSKGTLEDIVAQVTHGVPKAESKSGIEMPPRGGGTISDEEIRAVAAYVYSLGHK